METFGARLRRSRRQTANPARGGHLTQEAVGTFLLEAAGRQAGKPGALISNLELGVQQIGKDDRATLVALVKVLYQCGVISGASQADEWLKLGHDSPLDEREAAQVRAAPRLPAGRQRTAGQPISIPDSAPELTWPADIPTDRFYSLRGRECDLADLVARLSAGARPPVIAIDGWGGRGKTALAVELARRALRSGGWVGLLGASAKQGWLADGRIIALGSATLDEDDLLNALALHLGAWLAHPLYGMGLIARDRGDLTSGQAYVEASLKLLVTTDGGALPAQCYHFLGEVALLHAAHDVYRRVGDPRGVAGGAGCRAVASRGILGCASEAWKMVVALNPGVTARLRPRCRGGHV